jgi:hypothetical protein
MIARAFPLLLLAGCSRAVAPPAPPPCPAAVLSADAPRRGVPVEDTPAGQCLARRAEAGDIDAAMTLGDFYRTLPGTLPLIDRNGREVHWYRLAGNEGSPQGAWYAGRLIDTDVDVQVPNDALAYFIVAMKGGVPLAAPYLLTQWNEGRINPGKLWKLRRWLATTNTLPTDRRLAIIAALDTPPTEEMEEDN